MPGQDKPNATQLNHNNIPDLHADQPVDPLKSRPKSILKKSELQNSYPLDLVTNIFQELTSSNLEIQNIRDGSMKNFLEEVRKDLIVRLNTDEGKEIGRKINQSRENQSLFVQQLKFTILEAVKNNRTPKIFGGQDFIADKTIIAKTTVQKALKNFNNKIRQTKTVNFPLTYGITRSKNNGLQR